LTADPSSLGGAGGGGTGAFWSSSQTPRLSIPVAGTANTGGGGGGGGGATNPSEVARPGADGGSGVVVLRLDTAVATATTTTAASTTSTTAPTEETDAAREDTESLPTSGHSSAFVALLAAVLLAGGLVLVGRRRILT
jgi:LPXTG-motif cell wall-anchored protein